MNQNKLEREREKKNERLMLFTLTDYFKRILNFLLTVDFLSLKSNFSFYINIKSKTYII